jgi:hypothetical protein
VNVVPPFCVTTVLLALLLKPVPDESLLEDMLTFSELLELLLLEFTLTELWPLPSLVGTVCCTMPFWGTSICRPLTFSCTCVLLVLLAAPVDVLPLAAVSPAELSGSTVLSLEVCSIERCAEPLAPSSWPATPLFSATTAPINTNAPARE